MKKSELIKTSIAALALGLIMVPAAAMAQDVRDTQRATTDDILDAASERLDAQAEEETERQVETDLDAESRVTLDDYEVDDRSPDELEALKRELEGRYESQIDRFRQLIESQPYDAQRPNWMFQKAELLWELRNMEYVRERSEFNACMDAVYAETIDESECAEPQPQYAEPQRLYESVLQEFPDYQRLDEVIFRLGSGLLDAGEGAQAVGYLQRLVNNYPNSRYLADAYLALGEFFFDEQMTGAAKDNYEKVLEHENYRNFEYAVYKLGWTHFNMGEHRESADRFKQVIEAADSAAWSFLENQAANDLLLALAELPGGWIEARDYFTEMRDIDYAYSQLDRMAGYLEIQGQDAEAIAVYDWFMNERPNHANVPDWMDAIVRPLRETNFDEYEERVNTYVAYLHETSTWRSHNSEEANAINNAELFVEGNLARLANHYHRDAQRQDNQDSYVTAANYYQQFIDWFPDHAASFDMTFFLGEIYLHSLERYEDAARQYQLVVDLYNNDNVPSGAAEDEVKALVRDSAYNVVVSYNELVRTNHPESILVDMAERAGDDPEMTTQSIDEMTDDDGETPPIERTDLLQYELGFVTASDQFSDMYPEDDITPTVDYVAAEVYRSRGHYDNSIPRYESIITNAPQHRYASFAGNSLLESNYRLERWDEVERWARHLLENEIFDVTPRDSLTSAIAYSINESSINLMDAEKFDEASENLLRLAAEFPDSEFAPGALFNAAAIFERGGEVNRSVDIYAQVVADYPDSPQAPESLYVMGLIYEARADFARAAGFFERLGEESYRENENAADSVFNAAVLREAMEEWDQAISTYEDYLNFFGEEIDNLDEVELHLAFLEKEREDWAGADRRFRAYLQKEDVDLGEQVEIHLELGLLAERMQPSGWEEISDEHFTTTVELWEGLEDEDQKRTLRHQAAQARFHQAEVIFNKFKEVTLSFPVDRLRATAEEKAEYQQDAEQRYRQIISMGSPLWVAAASFRIGQSYQDFAEALFNLPMPEGLTPDQEFQYELSVEDLAFPLQEQALAAFNNALRLALEYQAYNEWSSRSAAEISDLEGEAFPITSQDGVNVEHNRAEFFSPAPVTDMGVVLERGTPRWDRLRPPPEPEIDPDADPETDGEGAGQAEAAGS